MRMARAHALGAVLVLASTACGPTPSTGTGPAAAGSDAGGGVCRPPLTGDEEPTVGTGAWDSGADLPVGPAVVSRVEQVAARDHPDAFAGAWVDTSANELVVMLTGDDPGAVLDDLRTHVEMPDALVCMHATLTEHDLERLLDDVFAALHPSGFAPSGGRDIRHNRVEVEAYGPSEEVRVHLGELADHPQLDLRIPACAEVEPPPADAVALPGELPTCPSYDDMEVALRTGRLAGDPSTGCLWLEDAGVRTDLVWPRAWHVTADGVVHDHHARARQTIEQHVSIGGRLVVDHEGDTWADDCHADGTDVWLVDALTFETTTKDP